MDDYKNSKEGRIVSQKYADILQMERPEPSAKHPRMSLGSRAKIFSPFAALRGFDDELAEEGAQTLRVPKAGALRRGEGRPLGPSGHSAPRHDRDSAVFCPRPALPGRPAGGTLPHRDRYRPNPGSRAKDPAPCAGQSAYGAGGGEGESRCDSSGGYCCIGMKGIMQKFITGHFSLLHQAVFLCLVGRFLL